MHKLYLLPDASHHIIYDNRFTADKEYHTDHRNKPVPVIRIPDIAEQFT